MTTRRTVVMGLISTGMAAEGALAAGPSPVGFQSLAQHGLYLPRWRELSDAGLPDRELALRSQFAAFLGEEEIALSQMRYPEASKLPMPTGAQSEDALDVIRRMAEGRRVVILNEAHVASRHRAFLALVLRTLRPLGFTHFAAEAFTHKPVGAVPDIASYRPGQHLSAPYGWYLLDPVFAEAVREAAELGYALRAYETREDQRLPSAGEDATAMRERVQAENLAKHLQANPDGRFLIYVGHGHIREAPTEAGEYRMAALLRQLTNIDPLTISQSGAGLVAPPVPSPPLAEAVFARFQISKPTIVLDGTKSFGAEATATDLTVFHPVGANVRGRPHWLVGQPGRRAIAVSVPPGKGPRLLQARHSVEGAGSIPADQLLVPDSRSENVLVLRPGHYDVALETANGVVPLQSVVV